MMDKPDKAVIKQVYKVIDDINNITASKRSILTITQSPMDKNIYIYTINNKNVFLRYTVTPGQERVYRNPLPWDYVIEQLDKQIDITSMILPNHKIIISENLTDENMKKVREFAVKSKATNRDQKPKRMGFLQSILEDSLGCKLEKDKEDIIHMRKTRKY